MIIKKRITINIEVDDLNHKHCAHTGKVYALNTCPQSFNDGDFSYCDLFGEYLKKNHRDYPIRHHECIKKFGMR